MSDVAVGQSDIEYPASDGQPMGETGRHAWALMDLVRVLAQRFEDKPDVYVGGNQFLYWAEGDPTRVVCPDVYVVEGRPNRPLRDTWRVWEEEGKVPTFILELTSRSTRQNDLVTKRDLYARLGVREYAIFDPLGEYLQPRLRLWRLDEGTYTEVPAGEHGCWSEVVGAWLDIDGALVRLREQDGSPVFRPEERARIADEQARTAAERARAETERAQAEAERAQAEAERAQAEAERAQAEAERADRAEAERDRLLAELERLRRG